MARLRTVLVTVTAGGAVLAGGAALATSASAAPVPVQAVSAVGAADTPAPSDGAGPVRAGAKRWWKNLSDTQRQCLENAKITRPVGPLTDAERATLREQVTKAADACDVELPFARARAFWDGLSAEQKQCLEAQKVTRPWGPMTKEQRHEVRADLAAAATTCGVELPKRAKAPAPSAAPSS